MRGLLLLPLALGASGCVFFFHDPQGTPGHVDLATPPALLATEVLERPRDPGERVRGLTVALLGGGGARWAHGVADTSARAFGTGTLQVGARFSESAQSHDEDGKLFGFLTPGATKESLGFNLGWTYVQGGSDPARTGALHAEVDHDWLYGFVRAGIGYAVSPSERAHGPQLTLANGPIYVRVRHLFGTATDLVFGLDVRALFAWVRSR